MIRHIAAIDSERGMAKNGAMPPWKLSRDEAYFTDETLKYGGIVLMGRRTFIEALKNRPLKGRTNYVVTRNPEPILGAIVVNDLAKFMDEWAQDKDLWIIGGAEIFAQTLQETDELYITEIAGNFECDRFYPEYKDKFELVKAGEPIDENGVEYRFCVYQKKS